MKIARGATSAAPRAMFALYFHATSLYCTCATTFIFVPRAVSIGIQPSVLRTSTKIRQIFGDCHRSRGRQHFNILPQYPTSTRCRPPKTVWARPPRFFLETENARKIAQNLQVRHPPRPPRSRQGRHTPVQPESVRMSSFHSLFEK